MSEDQADGGESDREKTDHDAPHLNEREETAVAESRPLSAVSIYTVVHAEGIEELERPAMSLWWSGVAAGLGISSSIVAEGILHVIFEGHPRIDAIENLGYTIGFVFVILARLQLFTENTITAILPLLDERSPNMLWCTTRLWAIVAVANVVGTSLTAAITYYVGTMPEKYLEGVLAISHHYYELTAYEGFAYGIPAGFLIAALVWMLPSSRGFQIFTIMLFTYLIALGGFTHVIAGSGELAILVIAGEGSLQHALALFFATFAGNVMGGTGLFALLAYGQVVSELDEAPEEEEGYRAHHMRRSPVRYR